MTSLLIHIITVCNMSLSLYLTGGGMTGQAGAVRLGISRALEQAIPTLRPELRRGRLHFITFIEILFLNVYLFIVSSHAVCVSICLCVCVSGFVDS